MFRLWRCFPKSSELRKKAARGESLRGLPYSMLLFFIGLPRPGRSRFPVPAGARSARSAGCHALLCPGEGLRLNVLGLFKADVLIDPGLDGAIVHLSRPLEAVAKVPREPGKISDFFRKFRSKCEWIFHRAVSLLHQAASVSRRQTLIPAMVSANTNQKMHITRGYSTGNPPDRTPWRRTEPPLRHR